MAITQALIQFIGSLSSWWSRIVIGVLMLVFIGVQAVVANREAGAKAGQAPEVRRRRQRLAFGFIAVTIGVLCAIGIFMALWELLV